TRLQPRARENGLRRRICFRERGRCRRRISRRARLRNRPALLVRRTAIRNELSRRAGGVSGARLAWTAFKYRPAFRFWIFDFGWKKNEVANPKSQIQNPKFEGSHATLQGAKGIDLSDRPDHQTRRRAAHRRCAASASRRAQDALGCRGLFRRLVSD